MNSILLLVSIVALDQSWSPEIVQTSDGKKYVSFEDYNKVANALKAVEKADLEVLESPDINVFIDENSRVFIKLQTKILKIGIGYIKKSIAFDEKDFKISVEMKDKKQLCPVPKAKFDRWYLGGWLNGGINSNRDLNLDMYGNFMFHLGDGLFLQTYSGFRYLNGAYGVFGVGVGVLY